MAEQWVYVLQNLPICAAKPPHRWFRHLSVGEHAGVQCPSMCSSLSLSPWPAVSDIGAAAILFAQPGSVSVPASLSHGCHSHCPSTLLDLCQDWDKATWLTTSRSTWIALQSTPLCVGSAALPAQTQHGFKEAYLSVPCANPTYVFVQLGETTALNPVLSTTSSKRCIFILFVM